jgi:hypothetical protein
MSPPGWAGKEMTIEWMAREDAFRLMMIAYWRRGCKDSEREVSTCMNDEMMKKGLEGESKERKEKEKEGRGNNPSLLKDRVDDAAANGRTCTHDEFQGDSGAPV